MNCQTRLCSRSSSSSSQTRLCPAKKRIPRRWTQIDSLPTFNYSFRSQKRRFTIRGNKLLAIRESPDEFEHKAYGAFFVRPLMDGIIVVSSLVVCALAVLLSQFDSQPQNRTEQPTPRSGRLFSNLACWCAFLFLSNERAFTLGNSIQRLLHGFIQACKVIVTTTMYLLDDIHV